MASPCISGRGYASALERLREQEWASCGERRGVSGGLRAKRRWGQLLPKPEPGKRSDLEPVTGGNGSKPGERLGVSRSSVERAAKVADERPELSMSPARVEAVDAKSQDDMGLKVFRGSG